VLGGRPHARLALSFRDRPSTRIVTSRRLEYSILWISRARGQAGWALARSSLRPPYRAAAGAERAEVSQAVAWHGRRDLTHAFFDEATY
jgi:hypothetical protein